VTDYEGTEMFVLLDQTQEMRSYEAIFGDLEGRRLVCIKRHLIKAFWRDGYYFCTYQPNYKGQKPLSERDMDNKKVYPFSYLQVSPMKGRFFYRVFDNQEGLSPPKLRAENPWLGYMVVCCTPAVRMGKWTASFQRKSSATPTIHIDQWRNCVDVGPGNDLLAALCMAYVFDRSQCQPLVTVFGLEEDVETDDKSIASNEDIDKNDVEMQFDNVPPSNGGPPPPLSYKDHPDTDPRAGDRGVPNDNGPYDDSDYYNDNGLDHLDDNGASAPAHPIYQQYDEFGNPIHHEHPLDEYGNPIVDDDQGTLYTGKDPNDWQTDDLFSTAPSEPQHANQSLGGRARDPDDGLLFGSPNNGSVGGTLSNTQRSTLPNQAPADGNAAPYTYLNDDEPSVAPSVGTLDPDLLSRPPAQQPQSMFSTGNGNGDDDDDASWLREDPTAASPSVMDAHFKQHQQRQQEQQYAQMDFNSSGRFKDDMDDDEPKIV
jgi:hypothetical protein